MFQCFTICSCSVSPNVNIEFHVTCVIETQLLIILQANGSMSRFKRLSDVEIMLSTFHAPWSVPGGVTKFPSKHSLYPKLSILCNVWQVLEGSFSAAPKPIVVTNHSICNIFKIYEICTLLPRSKLHFVYFSSSNVQICLDFRETFFIFSSLFRSMTLLMKLCPTFKISERNCQTLISEETIRKLQNKTKSRNGL